mmetsp:Transcript_77911/g.174684  ORF Transcript_77911/g.174684 Transcript_77911/m.174684 type:complete len:297 (-) Transcript_77911:969-1859(-)
MINDALPLSDQIKVMRELFSILDHRVILPSHLEILQLALLIHDLLPGLDTHFAVWKQDVVLCNLHFRLLHDKPLTGSPLLLDALLLGEVEATLHADNGLLVLTHRQLLQMVIGLEEDIAHARALQPVRLKALHLHGILRFCVDWIQGELRLPALLDADLQRNGKVLQVYRSCRVHGRRHTHVAGALIQHQAAKALRHRAPGQSCCSTGVVGNPLRLPADVVLRMSEHLLPLLLLDPLLLLAFHVEDGVLCRALCVHTTLLVMALVHVVAQGEVASATKPQLLAIRIQDLGHLLLWR